MSTQVDLLSRIGRQFGKRAKQFIVKGNVYEKTFFRRSRTDIIVRRGRNHCVKNLCRREPDDGAQAWQDAAVRAIYRVRCKDRLSAADRFCMVRFVCRIFGRSVFSNRFLNTSGFVFYFVHDGCGVLRRSLARPVSKERTRLALWLSRFELSVRRFGKFEH